jgi:hypothetical protein
MATIDFACPGCETTIKAPTRFAGRDAQCPKCSATVTIPAADPAAGAIAVPDATAARSASPPRHAVPATVALVAAVAGALVWAGIAYFTGYEVGWVAWGIGAVVGGAAVATGGRGQVMAVTCAGFALVAILGGKLLTIQLHVDSALRRELAPHYAEMVRDARDFARIAADATDDQVEDFMIDHEFHVPVGEFRAEIAPALLDFARTEPTFDDWAELYVEQAKSEFELSTTLASTLGMVDLVFAFLGISTAYMLVNVRTQQEATAGARSGARHGIG